MVDNQPDEFGILELVVFAAGGFGIDVAFVEQQFAPGFLSNGRKHSRVVVMRNAGIKGCWDAGMEGCRGPERQIEQVFQ